MVAPFKDYCFDDNKVGELGVVSTSFGVHIKEATSGRLCFCKIMLGALRLSPHFRILRVVRAVGRCVQQLFLEFSVMFPVRCVKSIFQVVYEFSGVTC